MRVLVVDDEPLARSGVVARLRGHRDIALVGEYGDGASALAGIRALAPDLLFLDVQMPGLSGPELLAALAPRERPMTILLTAHAQFALRAFELAALDYLLKPIDDARFDEALDRARRQLPQRRGAAGPERTAVPSMRFEVRTGRRRSFVDAGAIEWIGVDGDYAVLHAGGRSHLVREPLHQLARRLDPARFVRVHRSAIVRVDCVADLQPLANRDALLRLRDGTPLRASRTYIDALQRALLRG